MKTYIELIKSFSKENRFYWIDVLVKQKEISKVLAGYLIIYFNL